MKYEYKFILKNDPVDFVSLVNLYSEQGFKLVAVQHNPGGVFKKESFFAVLEKQL